MDQCLISVPQDVVREKHALQVQVNELLKQISGLRNQLDEMRHRTDFSDPSEATKRLQAEREKSEEKDKEVLWNKKHFSLPEQSSGKTIALPLALALVSVSTLVSAAALTIC